MCHINVLLAMFYSAIISSFKNTYKIQLFKLPVFVNKTDKEKSIISKQPQFEYIFKFEF